MAKGVIQLLNLNEYKHSY